MELYTLSSIKRIYEYACYPLLPSLTPAQRSTLSTFTQVTVNTAQSVFLKFKTFQLLKISILRNALNIVHHDITS